MSGCRPVSQASAISGCSFFPTRFPSVSSLVERRSCPGTFAMIPSGLLAWVCGVCQVFGGRAGRLGPAVSSGTVPRSAALVFLSAARALFHGPLLVFV